MWRGRAGQVKPWVTWADVLTALRVPLAVAFPFVHHPGAQLGVVAAVAVTDFFDGMLARRFGSSRAGAVLDPVADKLFMAAAFLTVARSGRLHPIEIAGVLARDIAAALAFLGAWIGRPPPVKQAAGRGTRIGLFGFSVRSGPDLSHGRQLVLGAGLDGGDLFSSRVRVRPSVEIGVFNGPNTYVASLEALYRFATDDETAVPYAGGGFSIAGHDGCGTDAACPALWANVVVGFELRYRSTFNWLFEYHAMDAFRRHRFYFGLTTRRGN